jgi:hypothetical protein
MMTHQMSKKTSVFERFRSRYSKKGGELSASTVRRLFFDGAMGVEWPLADRS